MNINVDDDLYEIDTDRIFSNINSIYTRYSYNANEISLKNGKTINFSKGSLLRVGIKQLVSMTLIPILKDLYESCNIEIEPFDKRGELDAIDYFVKCSINFISYLTKGKNIYVSTIRIDESNSKRITSISTTLSNKERKTSSGEEDTIQD